jgi:replicative DNA helicase
VDIKNTNKMPALHSEDLEQLVLGALMMDVSAFGVISDILNVNSFFSERHKMLFSICEKLYRDASPIDTSVVLQEVLNLGKLELLKRNDYIVQISSRVASTANLEVHAKIVAQFWIRRQQIEVGEQMIRDAKDLSIDAFDSLDSAEKAVFEISQFKGSNVLNPDQLSAKILERFNKAQSSDGGITGVPSGIRDIDERMGGFQNSDFGIIAARPGAGKTSLLLSMATHMAFNMDKSIAIFSLEMSDEQLGERIISIKSEISGDEIRRGIVSDKRVPDFLRALEDYETCKIYIDPTPAITLTQMRTQARKLKAEKDIDMIFVDYLQLMSGDTKNGNREQEISRISRGLKQLAKEINVPIISLAQLSRAVETRGGTKRPQLSDLRDSGSIEQDADWVSFLYRPEYYNILEDEEGRSLKGVAEFILAKNRHGPTGSVEMKFIAEFARFEDAPKENYFPDEDDEPQAMIIPSSNVTITTPNQNSGDVPF